MRCGPRRAGTEDSSTKRSRADRKVCDESGLGDLPRSITHPSVIPSQPHQVLIRRRLNKYAASSASSAGGSTRRLNSLNSI